MKDLKKSDFLAVILCLCAIIPGVLVYDKLPDRVVTHWDISSAPNGTSSKAFAVFGIPIIISVILFISCFYARKLEQKKSAGKLHTVMLLIFPMTLYLAQGVILLSALGKLSDIRLVLCLFLAVTMIILGNYMPKIRKNWVVGIRTPHIVSSDEIWYKTHRFGGFAMTICGVAAFVTALLGWFIPSIVIILASVIIPIIYGEVIYFHSKKSEH